MTPHEAFLQSIIENPADDAPRLIYADWLEQEGGEPERAEFIRVQCELAKVHDRLHDLNQQEQQGDHDRWSLLRKREQELFESVSGQQQGWATKPVHDLMIAGRMWADYLPWFRRGFIEFVTCTCQQWLDHGPAILTACPTIREVRLSDKRPAKNPYLLERVSWQHESVNTHGEQSWVLPDAICRCLIGHVLICKWYGSEVEALADLSQACLTYARASASLRASANV